MKRIAMLVCVSAVVIACDDGNPTQPANAPVVIRANIAAANEVPAVAGGTGSVTVTLNATRDADGIITGGTVDFAVSLDGFPPGTTMTAAHIHVGGAAANGPIVLDTGLAAAGGAVLQTGSGTITRTGVPVSAALAQAFLANPAAYYFNVHSTVNAGGAARGQLLFP
jgi:hypothetical protein